VELLTELSPQLSRIAGIVDPSSHHVSYWQEADGAAKRRGITLQYVEVRAESDLPRAFSAIVGGRARAVMIFGSLPVGASSPNRRSGPEECAPDYLHVSRGP
jgi:ABC-type uncharacterized transport system substrate-binding protein